jgi:hypothetical protein
MQRKRDNCVIPSTKIAAPFTHHTKDSVWETVAQRRMIARLCSLFETYSGERAWKAIGDRLRRSHSLSKVVHVRKIRIRNQRTDTGNYSFVNRTIKNWNQLTAEALGTSPCKPKVYRNRVRKEIVNGAKLKE